LENISISEHFTFYTKHAIDFKIYNELNQLECPERYEEGT